MQHNNPLPLPKPSAEVQEEPDRAPAWGHHRFLKSIGRPPEEGFKVHRQFQERHPAGYVDPLQFIAPSTEVESEAGRPSTAPPSFAPTDASTGAAREAEHQGTASQGQRMICGSPFVEIGVGAGGEAHMVTGGHA